MRMTTAIATWTPPTPPWSSRHPACSVPSAGGAHTVPCHRPSFHLTGWEVRVGARSVCAQAGDDGEGVTHWGVEVRQHGALRRTSSSLNLSPSAPFRPLPAFPRAARDVLFIVQEYSHISIAFLSAGRGRRGPPCYECLASLLFAISAQQQSGHSSDEGWR